MNVPVESVNRCSSPVELQRVTLRDHTVCVHLVVHSTVCNLLTAETTCLWAGYPTLRCHWLFVIWCIIGVWLFITESLFWYVPHALAAPFISVVFCSSLNLWTSVTLTGAAEARRQFWEDWNPVRSFCRGEDQSEPCRSEQLAVYWPLVVAPWLVSSQVIQ